MEKQIRIAAQLYGARDTAKFMLGADYHAKIEPYMSMIRVSAKNRKVDELKAACDMAKDVAENISGQAAVMVLAAYVELVEPSNVKVTGCTEAGEARCRAVPVDRRVGGSGS